MLELSVAHFRRGELGEVRIRLRDLMGQAIERTRNADFVIALLRHFWAMALRALSPGCIELLEQRFSKRLALSVFISIYAVIFLNGRMATSVARRALAEVDLRKVFDNINDSASHKGID